MDAFCSSADRRARKADLKILRFAALSLTIANFIGCRGGPAFTPPASSSVQDQSSRVNTHADSSDASQRSSIIRALPARVYVTNLGNNTVTTYKPNGERTVPTIRSGINSPRGVAVDAYGKIHVVNVGDNSVTTYRSNGVRTAPTIKGLHTPVGIAIDSRGKIYICNYGNNTLTTYDATGKRTNPTIKSGLNKPYGVAVDARGRIYVTNFGGNDLTSYNADGTRATPTIRRLSHPTGVAVDSHGKIYIASLGDNMLLTYRTNGKIGHPIISVGIGEPLFVALNSQLEIYIVNYAPPPPNSPDVAVYSKQGKPQSKITITTGLQGPVGVALSIHP